MARACRDAEILAAISIQAMIWPPNVMPAVLAWDGNTKCVISTILSRQGLRIRSGANDGTRNDGEPTKSITLPLDDGEHTDDEGDDGEVVVVLVLVVRVIEMDLLAVVCELPLNVVVSDVLLSLSLSLCVVVVVVATAKYASLCC
jgi:hypothetical protein